MVRWIAFLLTCILTGLIAMVSAEPASAYSTEKHWNNQNTVYYYIDPNLGTALSRYRSLSQTTVETAITTASGKWSNVSAFTLTHGSGYPGRDQNFTVDGRDFSTINFCGGPTPSGLAANTCVYPAGDGGLGTIYTSFNTSTKYDWNTSGAWTASPWAGKSRITIDVQAIILHEFGHWHFLDDGPAGHPEAVMNFNEIYKPNLLEDDKQGATQLYGPYIGWESGQTIGMQNTIAYNQNAALGYNCNSSPGPELSPVGAEIGVGPKSGSKMERMAGCGTSNYSYAYFTLFASDNDTTPVNPIQNRAYGTIYNGTKLDWDQWNYDQTSMSIDMELIDLSTGAITNLRDYHIPDQYGVSIAPSEHYNYAKGQWWHFTADLSRLQGKMIKRVFLAYDNANTHTTGKYRAYFDTINFHTP